MFRFMFVLVSFIVFSSSDVFAVSQIPREEFIKYTDTCIDVVDEIEVLLSNSKIYLPEAKNLNTKYELCMKKYERYGHNADRDRESLQFKVIRDLATMKFTYYVMLISIEARANISDSIEEIKKTSKEMKENFVKYREEPEPKKEEPVAKNTDEVQKKEAASPKNKKKK